MGEKKELRVAIYCRLAREDKDAIQQQEAYLREYAYRKGYIISMCYTDNGYSGLTLDNRPSFAKLNADISAGKIDAVLVRNETRIGRNFFEVDAWIDGLAEQGVSFITADYPYTPMHTSCAEIMAALCHARKKSSAGIVQSVRNLGNHL